MDRDGEIKLASLYSCKGGIPLTELDNKGETYRLSSYRTFLNFPFYIQAEKLRRKFGTRHVLLEVTTLWIVAES